METASRVEWTWKEVQRARKKSQDGVTVAQTYRPPGSLLPEAEDELPNEPSLHL